MNTLTSITVTVDDAGITVSRPVWVMAGRTTAQYGRDNVAGARGELEAARRTLLAAVADLDAMLAFFNADEEF
jgi:hypothetical protein